MSDYYTITGEHTGKKYLILHSFGNVLLFKEWSISLRGGLAYYPSDAINLGTRPRRADRKARRMVSQWEKHLRKLDAEIEKDEREFRDLIKENAND